MRTLPILLAAVLALPGCSNLFGGGEEPDTGDTDTDLPPEQVDDDGDGATEEEGDCDDEDPDVGPHQDEIPYNGVDDDCDESTPDDDLDGDGYGHAEDCDDEDPDVNPGETEEVYNGVDDDCDESTPDDDLDGDGFDADVDCDDDNPDINPGEVEAPYNGIDDDCDESTPDDDLDGDGYGHDDDCDDNDPDAYPGNEEDTTDGIDNDCDGKVDERFETEVVDASCDCGYPSAVDVDSAGQVHVAYYDADTGYLRYDLMDTTGAWAGGTDIVASDDASTGDWVDGVVDASDQFQVTYTRYDYTTEYLELDFIYRDASGTWSEEYIVDDYDESGSTWVGGYASIAVDSDGLPTFAYLDLDGGVPMVADYTSFGVALYYQADLNYAGTTGFYTSVAVDSLGYSHVGYYDPAACATFCPEVQYTKLDMDFDSLVWSESVDDAGEYVSLAIKSDDSPCMAYQYVDSADLKYACRASGSWSSETVASTGAVGAWASLAFNSADEPYIAYYDETSADLEVAHYTDGAWTTIEVDTDGNVGMAADIAIGDDDVVHITYYDASNGQLKHAWGQ